MAWTAPRTWVAGEIITASIGNTHWRDNLRYLKGLDGDITIEDDILTAFTVDGVDISAHKAGTAKAQHTAGAGDHTHQSADAEGSILDHGLALTGLLDNDHTQYILHSLADAANDFLVASGADAFVKKTLAETRTILSLPSGELYIPALPVAGQEATADHRGVLINAAGGGCLVRLLVPQDFTAITAIEVIFMPAETGASMYFNIITEYGVYSGGESYQVHSETANARNIGATTSTYYKNHSISDLVDVAALAAGDILTVRVTYNATAVDSNAYVSGLRLKYS